MVDNDTGVAFGTHCILAYVSQSMRMN